MTASKTNIVRADEEQREGKKAYVAPAIAEEEAFSTDTNLYCAKAVAPCNSGPGAST